MNPINIPVDPAQHGVYVPYFYHAGLHYVHDLPESKRSDTQYSQDSPAPDFASDVPATSPFAGPQTVEQIIATGYFAAPGGDPITAIITDKQHTSRLGLDDVIGQVRRRYEIYERNIEQIEHSKCAAINAIYQHEAYRGPGSADSRQHYAKHKAIQDLYEQTRVERSALWKDISRLRLLLPENAQQYLAAHRKVAALNAPVGDLQ